jgi:hypothetical protein
MESPPHYKNQKIQPIQYLNVSMPEQQFIGFLRGNVIKYVSRYDKKNGLDDLKKARIYLDWLIEFTETNDITVGD